MNLLFVCTYNKMRSSTAETIFSSHPEHEVRSAGTETNGGTRLTAEIIKWAGKIFVMERKHRDYILDKFPDDDVAGKIIVLNIPDRYLYMDPKLVRLLKTRVPPHIK